MMTKNPPKRGRKPRAPTLGQFLTGLREEAGLTRHAVAKRAGLSVSAYHRVEDDERADPRCSTVAKIAIALNRSLAEILTEYESQGGTFLPEPANGDR